MGGKFKLWMSLDTPENANELRYKVLDSWHQSHVLKNTPTNCRIRANK